MTEVRLTRAAVALRKKLRKRGAQSELTRALGCAEGIVSRWLTGARMPSVVQAAYIERVYRVRAVWWDEPPPVEQNKAA